MTDINPFDVYLKRGWSCFPVEGGGKKPLVKWDAYQTRLATAEEVKHWADSCPGCNIGIATGAVSGIIVVDIDDELGYEALKARGELPVTATVKTSKGWHLYFKHPGQKIGNRARFLPGVDLRGDGGYVVAPPSVHESGHVYTWTEKSAIAVLPDWLLKLLLPAERGPVSSAPSGEVRDDADKLLLAKALAKAVPGNRDEMGFWLACQLRDAGYSYGAAESVLREYAQMVARGDDPYTEHEAMLKVKSAFSQGAREPSKGVRVVTPRPARFAMYPEDRRAAERRASEEPPLWNEATGEYTDAPPDAEPECISSNDIYRFITDELLEEAYTLPKYPPFVSPYNVLHEFGGMALYTRRQKLIFILGGPGFGKTSFAETGLEALMKRGEDCLWYGPEWTPTEMGYRGVQRNGGMNLDRLAEYQMWRVDEARGIPPEQRRGAPIGGAVQSQSLGAVNAMTQWPGQTFFLPQPGLPVDALFEKMIRITERKRAEGRNIGSWWIDYLQIMRPQTNEGDTQWGERFAAIYKVAVIEAGVAGYLLMQPRKDDSDKVRQAAQLGGYDPESATWLLDQGSGQYISDQQCNLYVTLNPEFDEHGQHTGRAKANVVKNSLGRMGAKWMKTDFPHLRYVDAVHSTKPAAPGAAEAAR